MIQLLGTIQNVLETPAGKTKDGESYGGRTQVQLLCEETLRNGEKRLRIENLTVDPAEPWKALQGARIRVSAGAYAKNGAVVFTVAPGALPEPLRTSDGSGNLT